MGQEAHAGGRNPRTRGAEEEEDSSSNSVSASDSNSSGSRAAESVASTGAQEDVLVFWFVLATLLRN